MLQITQQDLEYLRDMVRKSVLATPTEYDAYGVITEAFILHKQPRSRYTIFPQMYLPWNPNDSKDRRGAIPDFGIGRYSERPPHVRLQGGMEVKRAVEETANLPPAAVATERRALQHAFRSTAFQAEDQAKAAVKGGRLPRDKELLWLIFVGPYFTTIKFGPFTGAQLITRGQISNDSGDAIETLKINVRKKDDTIRFPVYLLGTEEAMAEIEQFITTTQALIPES